MPEYPAPTTCALPVAGLLAESAAAARRYARNQNVVTDLKVGDGCAGFDNGADRLMTEDGACLHRGHIALEDMQVGAANGGGVDLDDSVGRRLDGRVGDGVPRALSGTVVYECFHGRFLFRKLPTDWAGDTSPIYSLFLAAASLEGRKSHEFQDIRLRTASGPCLIRGP